MSGRRFEELAGATGLEPAVLRDRQAFQIRVKKPVEMRVSWRTERMLYDKQRILDRLCAGSRDRLAFATVRIAPTPNYAYSAKLLLSACSCASSDSASLP